jgi:peptidoglycan/LPS O-acetylase OafA/YrhL
MAVHYLALAPLLPFPLGGALHQLAVLGWYGVELFFVLSGFLITGILLDARGQPGYFRNFYARRTLRIFPLYYLTLAILFVFLPRFAGSSLGFASVPFGIQWWYWGYASNVFLGLKGWAAGPPHMPHFWSLAVEEQFYLVWPLVVLLVPRRRLGWTFLGVALGALAWRTMLVLHHDHYVFTEVITPSRVDALAFGALIALIVRLPNGRERLTRALPALAVAGALAVAAIAWSRHSLMIDDPVVRSIGLTATSFALGTLVAAGVLCAEGGIPYRLMSLSPLRFIGRYSYAMYVFHYPVMITLRDLGFTVGSAIALAGSVTAGEAVFVAVNTGITLAISLLSWHLFEKRMLALTPLFTGGGTREAVANPKRSRRSSRRVRT